MLAYLLLQGLVASSLVTHIADIDNLGWFSSSGGIVCEGIRGGRCDVASIESGSRAGTGTSTSSSSSATSASQSSFFFSVKYREGFIGEKKRKHTMGEDGDYVGTIHSINRRRLSVHD